jgi:CDP-glycerol glycerophosphotransferase (TagB/SpsB family)
MTTSEPPIKASHTESGSDDVGNRPLSGGAGETVASESSKTRKTQIAFTSNDLAHACVEFRQTRTGYAVVGVCTSDTFKGLRCIEAVSALGRTELRIEPLDELENGRTRYKALIPRDVVEHGRTTFRAVMKSKQTWPVWTAGASALRLPTNWRFNIYHLYLQFDPNPPAPQVDTVKCYLRRMQQQPDRFVIDLTLFCARPDDLEGAVLSVIRFRDEEHFLDVPLKLEPARTPFRVPQKLHRKYTGLRSFYCTASIALEKAFREPWLYSLILRLKDGRLRGVYPYSKRQSKKQATFLWKSEHTIKIVHQFSDRSTTNLRLEYFELPAEHAAEIRKLLNPTAKISGKSAWLLGENINTARDNAWRLFEHLVKHREDINARYVITARNSDNILPDNEKVVKYGSIEHLRAARNARAALFAHHSLYVVPRMIADVRRRAKKKTLEYFLQHGVLALKPMLHLYKRSKQKTYTLFNVSSEWERALVAQQTGWNPQDITVAGLPRWDTLSAAEKCFRDAGRTPDSILVFPTWRNGLEKQTAEAFTQSAYYLNWRSALAALAEKSADAGMRLDFCAHSNFQRFNDLFNVPGVRNIDVLEAIDNLPRYNLLVTDYSSLTFDFLYLRKPTTFFAFDRDNYFETERPYIDFSEFPGSIALTPEGLVSNVFDDSGTLRGADRNALDLHRSRFIAFDESGGNCERVIAAAISRIHAQDQGLSSPSAAPLEAADDENAPANDIAGEVS